MAALPSPERVAGPFSPQYEVYWKKLDPNGTARVSPATAAQFLKLSGLSDQTLGKVWDLSDPEGNGFLDKQGLFTACKLVALSQANREITLDFLLDEAPAPNFGTETAPGAQAAAAPRGTPAPSVNFLVKPDEKRKYDSLFDQLKPQDGKLPGDRVRNVMIGSKLPMSMLGKIWDLSDQDKDGFLDRYEFTVSMHLVYRALQGDMIPDQLPVELSQAKVPQPLSGPVVLPELRNGGIGGPPGVTATARSHPALPEHNPFPIDISVPQPNISHSSDPSNPLTQPAQMMPSSVGPLPLVPSPGDGTDPVASSNVQAIPWVVNAGDRLRYEALFKQTDSDKDGFISGVEIKNVFLQTGLPQNILAHIWNLCDMKQEGKLNPEQFALAMYLVHQKQAGKDPPAALTPDMVPPTMRPKPVAGEVGTEGGGSRSVYNNQELELMAKEIQELLQEKMLLEREVQESEYNISVKNTETHSLQSEFDTLNSTLTQLTNQKNIAQKRLDDLDNQKFSLVTDSERLESRIEEELQKINKLRTQADDQEASLNVQEEEVNSKKLELEVLIQEETTSNSEIDKSQREIEAIIKSISDVESLLIETQNRMEEMEEAEKHMKDADVKFDLAMAPDAAAEASNVPDMYLDTIRISFSDPDFSILDPKPTRPPLPQAPATVLSPVTNGRMSTSGDGFSTGNASPQETNALFNNDDAFAAFTAKPETAAFDPFGNFGSSGFGSAASSSFPTPTSAFSAPSTFPTSSSPFSTPSSAFPSPFPPTASKPDAFDPFGMGATFGAKFDASPASRGDSPPALAPRPGESDSPTPALPPKNKAPPPKRPPPPRRPPPPKSGPAHPEPPRPPPPASVSSPMMSPPAEDDPFGGADAFAPTPTAKTAAGGFADFSNFAAFEEPQPEFSSSQKDPPASAFLSNTSSKSNLPNDTRWRNSHAESTTDESAFGSKSHTPLATPSVENKSIADSFADRYAGLDFFEDPFKNSDYRYGDPFDISTSDPFSDKDDPFASSDSAVFGPDSASFSTDPFNGKDAPKTFGADPFNDQDVPKTFGAEPFNGKDDSSSFGADPFNGKDTPKSFGADPFNGKDDSKSFGADPFNGKDDPFGPESILPSAPPSTNDPFAPTTNTTTSSDPFTGAFGKMDTFGSGSDPFGSSFSTTDTFGGGSNNNFNNNSGSDPFSLTNLNALKPPPSDINFNQSKQQGLSSTSSTISYRKGSKSSAEGTPTEKSEVKHKKHGHNFVPDFLSGSPLKTEKTPKEKKEKKHGKFNLTSPLKPKSKNSPKSDKKASKNAASSGEASADEIQLKMAAEVSRRTEDDRMRRMRLQEEQDLAYAIALSKAEAASLKSQ